MKILSHCNVRCSGHVYCVCLNGIIWLSGGHESPLEAMPRDCYERLLWTDAVVT